MTEGPSDQQDGRGPVPDAAGRPGPVVRLLVFGLATVIAVGVGFLLLDVEQSRVLIKRWGYFTIAGTAAWALLALWRNRLAWRLEGRPPGRRAAWQLTAVVAACTVVALLTTPVNYKILYDEMVLQATASDMHIYRDVSTVVRGYAVDGVFVPFQTYLDKRPFFYPFVVSLLHDLTGYREGNGFLVNVTLFPVILLQVYWLARRLIEHGPALIAVLSLGTLSTLTHSATGAGMETLNLSMLLLAMQLAVLYLQRPEAPRLAALVLVTVLLAQTRYESSLFVLSVALVGLEGWRRAGRVVLPAAAVLAPVLLIPYAIHNTYLSGTPALWELREDVQSRFGLQHLGPNLWHAGRYFFSWGQMLTSSLWLSGAGFAAAAYVGWKLWHRRRTLGSAAPVVVVGGAFALGVGANLALLMFYYWGQLDDPAVARLALPFSAFLALAIGYAVQQAQRLDRRVVIGAGLAAGFAYLGSGVIANEQHSRRNTLGTEIEWECRYVEALPPGERLMISNKSALPWLLRKIPSISVDRARDQGPALHAALANQTFREILVSQTLQPTTPTGDYHLMPEHRLPDGFVLEPVVEKRFGARLNRISRLVAVPVPKPVEARR